jgi:hypothetical protein
MELEASSWLIKSLVTRRVPQLAPPGKAERDVRAERLRATAHNTRCWPPPREVVPDPSAMAVTDVASAACCSRGEPERSALPGGAGRLQRTNDANTSSSRALTRTLTKRGTGLQGMVEWLSRGSKIPPTTAARRIMKHCRKSSTRSRPTAHVRTSWTWLVELASIVSPGAASRRLNAVGPLDRALQ